MSTWLQRALYQLLIRLIAPVGLWLGYKQHPQRWRERLGFYPKAGLPEQPIWLHAASLGEAKAALMLMAELRNQGYDGCFVTTSTTRTGADTLLAGLGPGDSHLYAPVDLPSCVHRALKRINPRLLLVMEVEIWPNLWATAQQREIPIVLANARLSDRSMRRYQRKLPLVWQQTLQRAALILAQSEEIAERFRTLGATHDRVKIGGNLKYSLAITDATLQQGRQLRTQWGDRPVWLAASTHEGEEQIALDCHRELLKTQPEALLVIVPRHPQRFDAVAELCRQSKLCYLRRSTDSTAPSANHQVYLADTLGELLMLFCATDLTWMAGSFVNVGGHNILEPAACGCPIIVGPDMRNFADILDEFMDGRALVQVGTPTQLGEQVQALLASPQQSQQLSAVAQQLSGAHAQANQTQAELLRQFL